ncbi:MAG TPA: cytochrome c oxidase subunit II [Anaerolineales bacterium]|nr:cytochrome c oxidase subunit II [Anaerolineales bacterium]
MRHFVIIGVLVILVSVLTYNGIQASHLMPVEASAQSIPVDWMWNADMAAIAFLFALIMVPLIYSLIVFRRRKGDTSDGEHIEGNAALEITWTVIPLITVVVFAYLGAYTLGETRVIDPNAAAIRVHAMQWAWHFEYPQGFTSDQLYLPVNKQVDLQMDSSDVIHSFWVPEFRIKQDVVPGRITEYRITPTLIGSYKVRCAELCGTAHSYMEAPVVVVSQSDYDTWIAQQVKAAAALLNATGPDAGKALVNKFGCLACHTVDGTPKIGPTWFGLYGSKVELSDGTTITANDAYIKQSILQPASQVVKGFSPMSFNAQALGVTDQQISNIIDYIKTLK